MKRGLFVTVEGTDGCGKTTQIRNIIDHLSSLGCRVVLTREPGGTRISENIRSIILDPTFTEMHSITELMLYSAARAQLVEQVIKPSIAKSETVICDRYIDSFYAYQGYGRGLDMDMLKKITSLAIDDMIPDITIFLDLDPEIGLRRRMNAANGDRIENEQIEFHRRVYDGYKQLARENPDRIKVIDASRSVEEVWQDERRQLDMALGFVREI
jgi:dTMP kinase